MTTHSAAQDRVFHQSQAGFVRVEGFVTGAPRAFLRLEGALAFAASMTAYACSGFDWKLFGFLFLAPDLSMLGYLAGPRTGAISYNLFHTYAVPFLLGAAGLWLRHPLLSAVSLIFAAHIGFDRMLGYGLKYPAGFGHTHLGKAGTSIKASSSSVR